MSEAFPIIRDIGLTGLLVTFAETMSEPANRAALAFRAAVNAEGWDGIEETATSLASVFIDFDPFVIDHATLTNRLETLIQRQDWFDAALPEGRTLWTIPTTLGGNHGPQWQDTLDVTGLDEQTARAHIAAAQIRVLTLGFAPGQPYMGELPEVWNIPRMTQLNPQVPGASLVVAIRQLIIFAGPAPTGWRHIGQTAFRCFRPNSDRPIALTPGDEVRFRLIDEDELAELSANNPTGDGGATREVLP